MKVFLLFRPKLIDNGEESRSCVYILTALLLNLDLSPRGEVEKRVCDFLTFLPLSKRWLLAKDELYDGWRVWLLFICGAKSLVGNLL